MSIIENKDRIGRFTSSQVYKLIPMGSVKMTPQEIVEFKKLNPKSKKTTKPGGFSALGLTYIKEKALERRMGASLDTGTYSQPAAWGQFMEFVIFSLLGLEYTIESQETVLHPDSYLSQFWSGSVDLKVPNVKVAEIKCYGRKNFGFYADCLMQKNIEIFKKDFPAEYWQIISNSCIHKVDIGEAISYMPYESEMPEIREMATNCEEGDKWKYRFIAEKPISELPCLPDNGYYENIVKFEFSTPKTDQQFLTSRIEEAVKLLNE